MQRWAMRMGSGSATVCVSETAWKVSTVYIHIIVHCQLQTRHHAAVMG